MSYEILYTSAPSGLKPGSSGYCTVQGSRGIPAPAVDLLESLSGYRHVFTPGSPEATHNPVNWGHYLIRIAGRVEHVLSRVGDCELDYTGRSNKLAHHLVVDAPTTATLPGGPAWFLSRPGLMYDQWDGTVSHLGTPRIPPPERRTAGQCAAWGGATGDAGWGGVLAESFLADPERKVFVVYAPGTNVLALFEEAIALLPEHRRWDVTFATYGAALPKTVDCLWSGLVSGSPEVAQSHRFVNALRIDLTSRAGRANGGSLVQLARTGVIPTAAPVARRATSAPAISEPVYEAGYQPVPPPPAILTALPNDEALEPPSLPPRRRSRETNFTWWVLVTLSLLLFVGMATGAFFALKKWRTRDSELGPAIDSQAIDQDEHGNRPPPTATAQSPVDEQKPNTSATSAQDKPASSTQTITQEPSGKPDGAAPPPMTEGMAKPDTTTKDASKIANDDAKSSARVGTDSQPSKPPVAAPESSDSWKHPSIVTASGSYSNEKTRPHAHTFEFPINFNLPFSTIARASFLAPRLSKPTALGDVHDTLRQTFDKSSFRLVPKDGIGTEIQMQGQIRQDPAPFAVVLTEVATLQDSLSTCFQNGILVLEGEQHEHLLLRFSPIVSTDKIPAIQGDGLRIEIPPSVRPLAKVIRSDDIRVSDARMNINGEARAADRNDGTHLIWNVADETDQQITSVRVETTTRLAPPNSLEIRIKFEGLDIATQNQSTLAASLQNMLDDMNRALKAAALAPIPDMLHFKQHQVDKKRESEAIENLIATVSGKFDSSKKKIPMDDKLQNDQWQRERDAALQLIDNYLSQTKLYRNRRTTIETFKKKLEFSSIRFVYRAYEFIAVDSESKVSALPMGTTYRDVDWWSAEAPN